MGACWEYFWVKMENTETRTWISMWINVEAKAFSLWSSVGWRPLALLVREPWNMRHFNTNACITAKRPHGPPDFWTRPNFSGSFEWKTKDCPEKETKVCVFTSFFFQVSIQCYQLCLYYKAGNTAGFIPIHPFGKGLHELPSNKDFKETASSMVIGILPLRGDAIMGLPILRSVINPLEKW